MNGGEDDEPVNEEEKPCSQVEAPRPIESEDGGEGASHPDFSDSGFGRTLCPPSSSPAFAARSHVRASATSLPRHLSSRSSRIQSPFAKAHGPQRLRNPPSPPFAPAPSTLLFASALTLLTRPTIHPYLTAILLVISSPTCPPIRTLTPAYLTLFLPFLSFPPIHLAASSPLSPSQPASIAIRFHTPFFSQPRTKRSELY